MSTPYGDGEAVMTIFEHMEVLAERHPDHVVIIDGAMQLTSRKFVVEARALACNLIARGLRPGDVVSYQLPNWHEAAVINLAAALAGFIVHPLLPSYRAAEIAAMIRDADSKVIIVPEVFKNAQYPKLYTDLLEQELARIRLTVRASTDHPGFERYESLIGDVPSIGVIPRPDIDRPYLFLHTAGSTAGPKCVVHSQRTCLEGARIYTAAGQFTRRDKCLVALPIAHIGGISHLNAVPALSGMAAVLMDEWNAVRAHDLISTYKITVAGGVPAMLRGLLEVSREQDSRLESLRWFGTGGTSVPAVLIEEAQAWFYNTAVSRTYGSTEVPFVSVGTVNRADAAHAASTDGLLNATEIRLLPSEEAQGEGGELFVRGPQMFLGYTDVNETAAAIDPDGFFRTGDIAEVVDGKYLRIVGRAKDVIIRSGENISPREIEDLLMRHPGIKEAAVVGIPDAEREELACAFVVLRSGHAFDFIEMVSFLSSQGLARYKLPERLDVLDALPRSVHGKVVAAELRALASRQVSKG